jgi:hypothetical protein
MTYISGIIRFLRPKILDTYRNKVYTKSVFSGLSKCLLCVLQSSLNVMDVNAKNFILPFLN